MSNIKEFGIFHLMQRITPSPTNLRKLSVSWISPLYIFESEDIPLSESKYWNLREFARISLDKLPFDEYAEHVYFVDTPAGLRLANLVPSGNAKKVILTYFTKDGILPKNLYDGRKDSKKNGLLIAPYSYPNKTGLQRCDSCWQLAFKPYPYIVISMSKNILGNLYRYDRNYLQLAKDLNIGHYTITEKYPETNYNPDYNLEHYLKLHATSSVPATELDKLSSKYMLWHEEMLLLYNWQGIGRPIFPLLSLLCFSHLNWPLYTDNADPTQRTPINMWGEFFNKIVDSTEGLLDTKGVLSVCERYPMLNAEYITRACRMIAYLSKKNKLPVGKFDINKFEKLLYVLLGTMGYRTTTVDSVFLPTYKTKTGYLLPRSTIYLVMNT